MSSRRNLLCACALASVFAGAAHAGTWTKLTHATPFNASTALLLTNGNVLVHEAESRRWFRLVPDSFGSYVNGSWFAVGSLPVGYAPLYYASAVLPDGRVIINGGEYNVSGGPVWTNKGAIYNPTTSTWASVAPPPGWANIGDAQSVVLANGIYMLANALSREWATLNPSTLAFTSHSGAEKNDSNNEENWTLLPDGSVFTVDASVSPSTFAERFYSNLWHADTAPPVELVDPPSHEIGPAVLRPNKTVFYLGSGNDAGTNTVHTAIYTPPATLTGTGTWKVGPNIPLIGGKNYGSKDGPATLLPSGNVLIQVSLGFNKPSKFFEFNGSTLTPVAEPPNAPNIPAFVSRMLCLPNGQILFTDGSNDVEIYSPIGKFQEAWRPVISSAPSSVQQGKNYTVKGVRFNGMSQCAAYGDDAQSATNYPLVRFTRTTTPHKVYYLKTHGHTSMAVNSPSTVSTIFDVPLSLPTGTYNMEVVANGIPSAKKFVTVTAHPGAPSQVAGFQ